MTIQAQLADGRVLEFPDGTDPAVVQGTVKRMLAGDAPASPVAAGGGPAPDFDPSALAAEGRETLSQENIGRVLGLAGPAAGGAAAAQALRSAPMLLRGLGAGAGTAAGDVGQQAGEVIRGEREAIDPAQTALTGAFATGGQIVGEALPAVLPGAIKRLFRGGERGRQQVQEAITDLAPAGAVPSAATATENALVDVAETVVSRIPGGRAPMARAVESTTEKVSGFLQESARKLSDGFAPDPHLVGGSVAKGLKEFVGRFRHRADQAYGVVDRFMDAESAVGVRNTVGELNRLTTAIKGAEATSEVLRQPFIARLREAVLTDAADGTIPFQALQQLRSEVGRKLNDISLVSDVPRGQLKQVYKAITEDIKAAADAAGPQALAAFEKANRFYRVRANRIDAFLDPLAKKDAVEKIFLAIESGAKQGPTQVREVIKGLNVEQRKVLAGGFIRRLGKANSSQQNAEGTAFSFETFLTNWDKLDDTAKTLIFKATPGMRANLDGIVRTAGRIRRSSQAFKNPPGTAGALVGQAMTLGAVAGAVTGSPLFLSGLAVASGGSNLVARLMTEPRFVRWLAQSSRVKPAGIAAHIGRLSGIAAGSDDETREAITEYLGVIGQSVQPTETPQPPQPTGPPRTERR